MRAKAAVLCALKVIVIAIIGIRKFFGKLDKSKKDDFIKFVIIHVEHIYIL